MHGKKRFNPRFDENAIEVLNECVAALKREMDPETRVIKGPTTLLVKAMAHRGFDNRDAQNALRALYEMSVLRKVNTGPETKVRFTDTDTDVVTKSMHDAWSERELWSYKKRQRGRNTNTSSVSGGVSFAGEASAESVEKIDELSGDEALLPMKGFVQAYETLRQEVSRLRAQNSELMQSKNSLADRLLLQEKLLNEVRSQKSKLREKYSELKDESARLAEELAELKRKYATAKENLAAAAGLLGDLQLD